MRPKAPASANRPRIRTERVIQTLSVVFIFLGVLEPLKGFSQSALVSSSQTLQKEASENTLRLLSRSPQWLKLLHYRETVFGHTSLVEDPRFFLATNGRNNPSDELRATLKAFQTETSSSELENSFCRFPARYLVLKRLLPEAVASWKTPSSCSRWERFRIGVAARSATLVFSAYYLNNPASAFGHTFLRLNKDSEGGKHHPLLDYGVGYAANATTSNPLMFALGGLFGWFDGEFTNMPYYLKVQEYNNFESRDLWEYDLNLDSAEVELLVAHIWEMASIKIPYRYLNINCASLLLAILESAKPSSKLLDRLPYWVIPSDTVLAIQQEPGFVGAVTFRPSKRSEFISRYRALDFSSREQFRLIAKARNPAEALRLYRGSNSEELADTLIDYYDFRNFKEIVREDSPEARVKREILLARSRIESTSPPHAFLPPPPFEHPENGHGSARASVGYASSSKGEKAFLISQRFALHDHLDPQTGYPRDSAIDFLSFRFRFVNETVSTRESDRRLLVEEAYAFAVRSYAPYETMIPNFSWRTRIGAERTWDESCPLGADCVAAVFGGAAGLTWNLGDLDRIFASALVAADISHSPEFLPSTLKLRIGPELNIRAILTAHVLAQFNLQYLHLFFNQSSDAFKISGETRWTLSSIPLAFGALAEQKPRGESEVLGTLFFYY